MTRLRNDLINGLFDSGMTTNSIEIHINFWFVWI